MIQVYQATIKESSACYGSYLAQIAAINFVRGILGRFSERDLQPVIAGQEIRASAG